MNQKYLALANCASVIAERHHAAYTAARGFERASVVHALLQHWWSAQRVASRFMRVALKQEAA
jgi:hypothetical protein